jgi:hypothetical protein
MKIPHTALKANKRAVRNLFPDGSLAVILTFI